MHKLSTTLVTLVFLLFTPSIQAIDAPPEVFVDAALDGCTKYASKQYCLCEAQIRYDNLTDKEKGLMTIILEIEATNSNSNLNLKKLYKSSKEKYDPDGNIQKGIIAKKDKIEKEIRKKCNK